VCYDNTNHKVAEREGCIGKAIKGSRKSIVKPSTITRIRAMTEEHGREGIEVHNS
jgi:N6-adenosine-specific RNA methylase IME4